MTRPMSEDSPGKQAANYGYRIRQLERRPADPGCPCPIPWARLGLGGGTADPDTWTNADFSQAMTYNEEVAGDVFTLDDAGDRWRLILAADGLYMVDFLVSWTNYFAEASEIDCTQAVGDWLYSEKYALVNVRREQPATASQAPSDLVQHVCAMAWVSDSVSSKTLDPRVWQSSSIARAFDALSLRVMYFGAIGAEVDWIFDTT